MGYSYHGRGTHSCLCHNMTLNALSSAVSLLLQSKSEIVLMCRVFIVIRVHINTMQYIVEGVATK